MKITVDLSPFQARQLLTALSYAEADLREFADVTGAFETRRHWQAAQVGLQKTDEAIRAALEAQE